MIETPRHVHQANGVWKRVENQAELESALAEGWVIDPNTLTKQVILTDAPDPEPDPEPEQEPDSEPASELDESDSAQAEAPKKRGRPGKTT